MKRLSILVFTAAIIIFVSACSDRKENANQEKYHNVDTIPQLVMQIQKCSRLYTAEYKVHKIVTHNDEMRLKGSFLKHSYDIALPVGERKVAIPMDATVKAYIDFTDFSEKNIKRNGNKVEIILPDPRVQLTATKINHNEIKKYVALMRQNFSDAELANYEQQGRDAIVKDIPNMGITDMAMESAAKVITPFFVGLGFAEKDIIVTFRKDFTTKDILKMIDPTTVIEGK